MGNKTIHLDIECEEILNQQKAKNPNFNFSQFISEALRRLTQKKITEEMIVSIINEAQLKEIKAKQDIEKGQKLLSKFKLDQDVANIKTINKEQEVNRQKEDGNYEVLQKIERGQELRRSGELYEDA